MHAGIVAAVLIAGQSGAPGSFWSPPPGECSSLLEVAGPPATQGQSSSSVQVATAGPRTSQQAEEDAPVHWDFSSHPRLVLSRGTFVDFRVKLQWDHRTLSPSPEDPADDAEWELGRVGVEGQVTRLVEFEVSFDVPDEADPWRAVFLNVRPLAALRCREATSRCPSAGSAFEADRISISSSGRWP